MPLLYNIPNLNSIFQTIGISVGVISGLIGIGLGYVYVENISHIRELLKELGEEKQVLKQLVHRVANITNEPIGL